VHGITDLEWDALVTRAEDERLAPLLYVALRDGAAPPAVLARLRAAWMAAERQHLLAGCQLAEILAALDAAGIAGVVLKGPALADEYYADPALRPFTDLDLLVRRRERERAIEVLGALAYVHGSPGRSLGYELDHAAAAYFVAASDTARLPVDLHWDFICHPGGGRATELAADEIWARATPAWKLAPEDLLVYLAAHFAIHHSLAGVLWQLDLALVLRRHSATLDWDAVAARARRWGAGPAVYFALRSVGGELAVVAPTEAMSRLHPGHLRAALVERLQRGGAERLSRLEYLVDVMLLDRLSHVITTVLSGLIPQPAWVRARYERRSVVSAYLAHFRRVIGIVTRALFLLRPRRGNATP
jgi:hypothetical protein